MSERKNRVLLLGFVLSVSLLASAFTAVLTTNACRQAQFDWLGGLYGALIDENPAAEQTLAAALKSYAGQDEERHKGNAGEIYTAQSKENILTAWGYEPSDFGKAGHDRNLALAVPGFVLGAGLFILTLYYRHRKDVLRIQELTDYLEQANAKGAGLAFTAKEDDFSKLQDEIYKTVTMLQQTRDLALAAKNNFAENLSNIAHQLKTPITAISLSTQMLEKYPCGEYPGQIQRQLLRLTRLEEALLLLSRMDAGTLTMQRKRADVFTVLTLAADNLWELLTQAEVFVDIPELGEAEITVDLDWTMEAVMNLLKNCMEHTEPKGTVHCTYEQNPLYTQICIRDEGEGFAKEDLPHLFERFYRGRNAKEGGIGIGLALAKEIIERQNGTIRAGNMPDGGACFEIRFYSH